MILLFHWIIAYCKTTKRLNFTNMNLPFVVINLLIVCLSIAGHTTQGYTGCHKHVYLLLGLILVTSKRSGMLGQTEYVALGTSMILCSTADLVPTSVCLPFGASGFKFGSWVNCGNIGVPRCLPLNFINHVASIARSGRAPVMRCDSSVKNACRSWRRR